LIDLNVWRQNKDSITGEVKNNRDGTSFIAYDIRRFPKEILIDSKPEPEEIFK